MSSTPRSSADAASSVDALQSAVIAKFESADAAVSVRRTGYFNHTYAPDLVLRWSSAKEERHVFIRTSDSARYLAEDIDLARDRDPIFVPLGGVAEGTKNDGEAPLLLASKSRQSRALVVESQTIDALSSDGRRGAIGAIAARAVLQGGSGVVLPDQATHFGDTIALGFTGALRGDEAATGDAVRQSAELLDDRRTAQLAELLQAAWIGGGQSGTTFPGLGIASSAVEPEALKLLLDTVDVDDTVFWSRLARGLTLAHFSNVTISDQHPGFQMLMQAAATRLNAKGARAVQLDAQLLTSPRWAVDDGRLSLAIRDARLEFVDRSVEDFTSAGVDASPSVRVFAARAQKAGLKVLRVSLSSNDRRLDFASEDGTSVAGDDRLVALESDIGVGATVLKATVETNGRELGVSLQSGTASGHTRSLYYLSTLVKTLLPLVTDFDDEGRAELDALFRNDDDNDHNDGVAQTAGV
jgi:hypothetical protein